MNRGVLNYSHFYDVVISKIILTDYVCTRIDGVYYFYGIDRDILFKGYGFWGKSPGLKPINIKELEQHINIISRRDKINKIKERLNNE